MNIDSLSQKLMGGIAFTLPFQIFALTVGGKAVESAHFLSLLLILPAALLVVWKGRFQRLAVAEKGVLLCFGVACLSLVAGQLTYGWPEQLSKGLQQIVGLAYVVMLFLTVRRSVSTPGAFQQVVSWLWRGLMVLAVLGLWQWLAFNLLKVTFLADWSWAKDLNPSIGGWRFGEYMGPIARVNSFAPEPAFYCQLLMMGLGLVMVRLIPPPWVSRSVGVAWKAYLPSKAAAIMFLLAYILSLSLLGLVGLFITTIGYMILSQRAKRISVLILVLLIMVFTLDFFSGKTLSSKFGSIVLIIPGVEKEIVTQNLSALALAANLEVILKGFMINPFLGWGIGGHATAFILYAPTWAANPDLLPAIGTWDPASLLLRLISEMGLIGLVVFTGTFLLILWQAWRAVRRAGNSASNREIVPLCTGLLIGAIAMILIYLVRMSNMLMISFWFPLALVSAIPQVLESEKTDLESTSSPP